MALKATRLSRKIPIEEALVYLRGNYSPRMVEGYSVTVLNIRMMLFAQNTNCVECGLKGTFFVVEQQMQGKPYLNLYADTAGGEVLMTRDHTIALADGGSNDLSNSQTMCSPCNGQKGSHASKVQEAAYEAKRKLKSKIKQTKPMELKMFYRLTALQKAMGELISKEPSKDDYKTYMDLMLKQIRKAQQEDQDVQQRASREVRSVQKRKRA